MDNNEVIGYLFFVVEFFHRPFKCGVELFFHCVGENSGEKEERKQIEARHHDRHL